MNEAGSLVVSIDQRRRSCGPASRRPVSMEVRHLMIRHLHRRSLRSKTRRLADDQCEPAAGFSHLRFATEGSGGVSSGVATSDSTIGQRRISGEGSPVVLTSRRDLRTLTGGSKNSGRDDAGRSERRPACVFFHHWKGSQCLFFHGSQVSEFSSATSPRSRSSGSDRTRCDSASKQTVSRSFAKSC